MLLDGVNHIAWISKDADRLGRFCTDVFDAWRNGSLQKMLDVRGVTYDRDLVIDPYTLLPKWLQPRKSACWPHARRSAVPW